MTDLTDRQPWHLDKRIPLALIGAILVQTGAAFWWAATQNARVTALEEWRSDTKSVASDIATITANIKAIQEDVQEVKERLRDGKMNYRQFEYQPRPSE